MRDQSVKNKRGEKNMAYPEICEDGEFQLIVQLQTEILLNSLPIKND